VYSVNTFSKIKLSLSIQIIAEGEVKRKEQTFKCGRWNQENTFWKICC